MPVPYAKISMTTNPGIVVNTQMVSSGDPLDPNFTWVNIAGLSCVDGSPIQINCTYDGTNFYAPA